MCTFNFNNIVIPSDILPQQRDQGVCVDNSQGAARTKGMIFASLADNQSSNFRLAKLPVWYLGTHFVTPYSSGWPQKCGEK